MTALPRCCVVVPVYNEAAHLRTLIPEVFAQAALILGYELWLLIVDDDSPDGTAALVGEMQARYPRLLLSPGTKRGLGMAYQRGFEAAMEQVRPSRLVQMDGDGQHDPAALPFLIAACGDGVGAAVGSRFAPGGATPAFSRRRRVTSQVGNWLLHRWAGLPRLHDYTSGFRCLDAALAVDCVAACARDGLALRGYAFQSSLIAEILVRGAAVREVPIIFGQRAHDRSKLGRGDYLEFLANLSRLRRRVQQAQLPEQ